MESTARPVQHPDGQVTAQGDQFGPAAPETDPASATLKRRIYGGEPSDSRARSAHPQCRGSMFGSGN